MRATQVVQWTLSPSLAISADGCVVATNEACDRLTGLPPQAATEMHCWDVVKATDASGERVCSPTDCPTLEALGEGEAPDLQWSGWMLGCGAVAPLRATAIAVPPGERSDQVAAVIFLNLEPGVATESPADASPSAYAPVEAPRSDVRVRLLGSPECWNGRQRQRINRHRVFELLTLLALSGEWGCTREGIVDTLWPDAPRGNGRQHLRVLLHAIRKALGADSIETVRLPASREERLRLSPHVRVDLTAFEASAQVLVPPPARGAPCLSGHDGPRDDDAMERFEEAIGLYRGGLDECGKFGEWVAPHRERLRAHYLALLTAVVPALARCGRIYDAIAYCEQAVEVDPLAEPFQLALLTAYGHLGRRSAVLAQYRNYRWTLARELQMVPSGAIERAFRQAMASPGSRPPKEHCA